MGLIKADTGADLLSGENLNVMADYYGKVMLTSKNLIPDPGLNDIRARDNNHRYWQLGHSPRPTHWGVFVRDKDNVKQFARQVTAPLSLRTSILDLESELARGAPLEHPSRTADIPAPNMPKVEAFPVSSEIGLPAGYYTMAFVYIASEDWENGSRITNPGARGAAFYLAQGQGVQLPTPPEISDKATAIGVCFSEPRSTPEEALLAPLYLIRRFSTRNISQYVRVVGPFQWRNLLSNVNGTYIGKMSDLPLVNHWTAGSAIHHARDIFVKLGYSIYTSQGMSKSSLPKPSAGGEWVRLRAGKNSLAFKPPRFPTDTIGWRPEVRFLVRKQGIEWSQKVSEGITDWYAISKDKGGDPTFDKEEAAYVLTEAPELWKDEWVTSLRRIKRGETDFTGLPAPTEVLDTPIILDLATSGLTPGPHQVKTALFVRGEEGPHSRTRKINVAAGNGLRIHRPMFHNVFTNSDLGDRKKTDVKVPVGWEIPKPFPTNVDIQLPNIGVVDYNDRSGLNVNLDAFKTPLMELDENIDKFVAGFKLDMTEAYTSGRLNIDMEELDNAGTIINTQNVGSFIGDEYDFAVRLQKVSEVTAANVIPDYIKIISSLATRIRFVIKGIGTSKSGSRNFKAKLRHIGVFPGHSKPIKAVKRWHGFVDRLENDDETFPHGGYCEIIKDPIDGPTSNDSLRLNTRNFENGAISPWVEGGTTGEANLVAGVSPNGAISGTKGWRIRKTAATVAAVTKYLEYTFAATDEIAAKWDIRLRQIPADTVMNLGQIRSGTNGMVTLRLEASGNLSAIITNSAGIVTATRLAFGLDQGDRMSVELYIQGAGTTTGSVKSRVGLNGAKRKVGPETTGIDWTGRLPSIVRAGVVNGDVPANTWILNYDNLIVSRKGLNAEWPLDIGNYIEYYGPYLTPQNSGYGPYDMKVPVKPGQTYTISGYVYYEDLTAATDLLRMKVKNRKHETIHNYGALIDNIQGDSLDWERYSFTFTAPAGARYIHFFGNNLGGGRFKLGGLQMEKGNIATDFSRTNATSGYLTILFGTRPEGIKDTSPTWWLGLFEKIRELDVLDSKTGVGSVVTTWRSGNTLAELDAAAFTSNLSTISPSHSLLEARVDISTTDINDSPEVRSVFGDLKRLGSTLCRRDGTEYKGGVNVTNVSAVHAPERATNIELASGGIANAPWGTNRVGRITFDMEAYHRSTVEEIVANKKQLLELPDVRYEVFLEEPPQFSPHPNSRIYGGPGEEFFQRETAEGVTAWIVSKDVLD